MAYFSEAGLDTGVDFKTLFIFRWESAYKLRFKWPKFIETLFSSISICCYLLHFLLIKTDNAKIIDQCVSFFKVIIEGLFQGG